VPVAASAIAHHVPAFGLPLGAVLLTFGRPLGAVLLALGTALDGHARK
jgi:hypothetical protein